MVSSTIHRLMPSMPTRYCRPMLFTHVARSTIWKPAIEGSNRPSTPRETTNVARAVLRAVQRAALSESNRPPSNRIASPTSGRKTVTDRMCAPHSRNPRKTRMPTAPAKSASAYVRT